MLSLEDRLWINRSGHKYDPVQGAEKLRQWKILSDLTIRILFTAVVGEEPPTALLEEALDKYESFCSTYQFEELKMSVKNMSDYIRIKRYYPKFA